MYQKQLSQIPPNPHNHAFSWNCTPCSWPLFCFQAEPLFLWGGGVCQQLAELSWVCICSTLPLHPGKDGAVPESPPKSSFTGTTVVTTTVLISFWTSLTYLCFLRREMWLLTLLILVRRRTIRCPFSLGWRTSTLFLVRHTEKDILCWFWASLCNVVLQVALWCACGKVPCAQWPLGRKEERCWSSWFSIPASPPALSCPSFQRWRQAAETDMKTEILVFYFLLS